MQGKAQGAGCIFSLVTPLNQMQLWNEQQIEGKGDLVEVGDFSQ